MAVVDITERMECDELLTRSYVPNPHRGERMYFVCSNCGKRVRFLCGTTKGFVCRVCGNLNYGIQQSGREDVLVHRIEKTLHALQVDTNLMNLYDMTTFSTPERPRYMRWNKFYQLSFQLIDYQSKYLKMQNKKLSYILK